MRGGKKTRRGDGIGAWWLVIGAATIFIGIPLLIYEQLSGFIVRRIPGGRERQARGELRRLEKDVESASKLAKGLAGDLPEIEMKLVKYAERQRRRIERHVAEGGWLDDLNLDGGVWGRATDLLVDAGRIAGIDWKSPPDEIEEALAPMLQRYGVAFDWSFAEELEAAGDWESLKTDAFLELAGERIAALGHVLLSISDGSDGYLIGICTPAEYAAVSRLSDTRNDYSVGKS